MSGGGGGGGAGGSGRGGRGSERAGAVAAHQRGRARAARPGPPRAPRAPRGPGTERRLRPGPARRDEPAGAPQEPGGAVTGEHRPAPSVSLVPAPRVPGSSAGPGSGSGTGNSSGSGRGPARPRHVVHVRAQLAVPARAGGFRHPGHRGRALLPGRAHRGVHGGHQEDHQIHDLVFLGRAGGAVPVRAIPGIPGGSGALHQPRLLRIAPNFPFHRPHLLQLHPILRAGCAQSLPGIPIFCRGILPLLRGPGLFHLLPVAHPLRLLRVAVGRGERPALHRAAGRRRRLQLFHQGEKREALRDSPGFFLPQGSRPSQPPEDLLKSGNIRRLRIPGYPNDPKLAGNSVLPGNSSGMHKLRCTRTSPPLSRAAFSWECFHGKERDWDEPEEGIAGNPGTFGDFPGFFWGFLGFFFPAAAPSGWMEKLSGLFPRFLRSWESIKKKTTGKIGMDPEDSGWDGAEP